MLLICSFVLNLMACSKIGCDLFPLGDGAIPKYIDSVEKDSPCQSYYYYYYELTLLFLSICLNRRMSSNYLYFINFQ